MKHRSTARFVLESIEGIVSLAGAILTWPVLQRWLRNWGSSVEDRRTVWPGDTFVAANLPSTTRAIDVAAPSEVVWPWLAQFGLGKAGFYSYELLERLAGIPVTNVESNEPSMQSIREGDEVVLHPRAPGIPVAKVDVRRCICFADRSPEPGEELRRSWSFYLTPESRSSCRLVVRGCFEQTRQRSLRDRVTFAVEQPVDFVMEQRMLRTIKRLAEEEIC